MILKCLYIDAADPAFLSLPAPYEGGFLDAEALRRYLTRDEYELSERFVTHALAMNDECFAIRAGDTLAAYGWYSFGAHRFSDEHTLRFAPPWVYMHHGFTHPAHRGRRLHAIGMTMALAAYQARGFRGLVSLVAVRNDASLKSCYRMGYRPFGTLYTVRLGHLLGLRHSKSRLLNVPLAYCTPGCRAFGFWLQRATASEPATGEPEPLKS
jgi:L-amino acid N-acyltransferase YncA